ncbi:siderophore-interacting protein [Actinoplanes sp. CA-054009]
MVASMMKIRRPGSRRMIELTVLRNARVSTNFRRVTLGGPGLADLENSGSDQAVRLFFPRPGQESLFMPTVSNDAWMAQFLMRPKARRPYVRNYTIRAFRPAAHEIDIEFALHGSDAPASAWAASAAPGSPAGIFDEGIAYLPPAGATWQLLVADESAVPAVLAILEQAPASLRGHAYLEVPDISDIRDISCPAGVTVHWLPRTSGRPGALALETVKAADPPAGPFYAWVAGEAALPTGVRRHLVNGLGVPRSDVNFIGYWRHGRSAPG